MARKTDTPQSPVAPPTAQDLPEPEGNSFQELLRRVQAGDPQAERDLWDLYSPAIQRVVRARLYHRGVRRVLDSADVCQSVFCNFFLRFRQGQFALGNAADLFKLLFTMARHKVLAQLAHQCAGVRSPERLETAGLDEARLLAGDPTPSQQAAVRDLAEHYLHLLPPDERRLAELYFAGNTWEEIAAQVGGLADSLRIRLMRAINRLKPRSQESGVRSQEA
jgi:RNA polymerase sigma factor (sigma-70 family)